MFQLITLTLALITAQPATASGRCAIHLVNDRIDRVQVEFARQIVQSALPDARDVTLVRLGDLPAGVRSVGYAGERAAAFDDLVDGILRTDTVGAARANSALGRAARRLALSSRNSALVVALLHQQSYHRVALLFVAREIRAGAKPSGKSMRPTFTDGLYESMPDAPTPFGLVLIDPSYFVQPTSRPEFRSALLGAMSAKEALTTLHDWALLHRERLSPKGPTASLPFLWLNRGGVVIDEALGYLLTNTQSAASQLTFAKTADLDGLREDLTTAVRNHPGALRLVRRLGLDLTPDEMIEWSEDMMERLHDEL